jgi:ABC-type multidrug transport system ATPase subunit
VGADPDGVRAAIGVTGQFSAVDDLLTGEENPRLMADLNHLGREAGRARVAELLARFDLVEAAHRPAWLPRDRRCAQLTTGQARYEQPAPHTVRARRRFDGRPGDRI